jgi:hypothetical protein
MDRRTLIKSIIGWWTTKFEPKGCFDITKYGYPLLHGMAPLEGPTGQIFILKFL